MEITEKGTIESYEVMPTEKDIYLSLVRYENGLWLQGPSGHDKQIVINQLQTYSGVDAARIYKVKVPVNSIPAG